MPVLPDGKAVHGNGARMDGKIIGLRERFADVTRQRGDQIGSLDDRPEPQEAGQLKRDVTLDALARQRLFEQLRPISCN